MDIYLGKIKLTTRVRVNAFEKRNTSELLRQLFIKEQLKAKRRKNKSRLVILYDTKLFYSNFIINKKLIVNYWNP